jgi:hypothetical protein
MMTILAMVNAEKEGLIESKILKAVSLLHQDALCGSGRGGLADALSVVAAYGGNKRS